MDEQFRVRIINDWSDGTVSVWRGETYWARLTKPGHYEILRNHAYHTGPLWFQLSGDLAFVVVC